MTKNYYRELQALCGATELKTFAGRLMTAKRNAILRNMNYPPIPNIMLHTCPGAGITTMIQLLAGMLREHRLMRFSGEEACFEISISDMDEDMPLLLKRVNTAAGFYGEFRGVIGLDLSRVLDGNHFSADDARRMLDYIELKQGKILFVYIVPSDAPKAAVEALERALVNRAPLENINVPFPETGEIVAFIEDRFAKLDMSLDEGCAQRLQEAVNKLRSSSSFMGYRSLNNLIDELTWRYLSDDSCSGGTVSETELCTLLQHSGLLGTIKERRVSQTARHIGFEHTA